MVLTVWSPKVVPKFPLKFVRNANSQAPSKSEDPGIGAHQSVF